jgi:hypothetical protein
MMKLHILLLALVSGLSAWTPVKSEVTHVQHREDNLLVLVRDDTWQPENFQNGISIPATYVKHANITLDGMDDEAEWATAKEVSLSLDYGNVDNALVKAVYTDEEVYIRVRWQDDSEDRDHHPWVWDPETEQYIAGPQVEDSVLLSFEAGCEWSPSLLSGYIYDFDGWHWMAARTDPVSQARDLYGSSLDQNNGPGQRATEYPSRTTTNVWNVKFDDYMGELSHQSWSELDRRYLFMPVKQNIFLQAEPDKLEPAEYDVRIPAPLTPPEDENQSFPQYTAVQLEGDAGEVSAKGHWQDGYWTVEFHRSLRTPSTTLTDTVFSRLTQFSIHVFDSVESVDQASESQRLFLEFLPEKPALAKE